MKAKIHPTYYDDAHVRCACGNEFITGSIKKEIRVEICYKCHPLYTGEKRFVDTLGQVGKFQKKQEAAKVLQEKFGTKKQKDKIRAEQKQKSLRELLSGI